MASKRKLLTVDDIQGAWAIIPTPAKDGASDWRAQDTVDLDETARAVEGLIEAGIDGILSLGTFGEGSTCTWDEKKKFIATAVEAARGRVPFFTGSTTLNTRDTVAETRFAYDVGADGTMLGLPMWCGADLPVAVQFYKDVAEACPDGAICVYPNSFAFKFPFPREFWEQVSVIPQIVAAKVGRFIPDVHVSSDRIRYLPVDGEYYESVRIDPKVITAFWSGGASCGPTVATRLRDKIVRAKATNEWDDAKALSDAIGESLSHLLLHGDQETFGRHNIGLEKERINAAGWMKAGPVRPPYHVVPEEPRKSARLSAKMWAALDQKLRAEG